MIRYPQKIESKKERKQENEKAEKWTVGSCCRRRRAISRSLCAFKEGTRLEVERASWLQGRVASLALDTTIRNRGIAKARKLETLLS